MIYFHYFLYILYLYMIQTNIKKISKDLNKINKNIKNMTLDDIIKSSNNRSLNSEISDNESESDRKLNSEISESDNETDNDSDNESDRKLNSEISESDNESDRKLNSEISESDNESDRKLNSEISESDNESDRKLNSEISENESDRKLNSEISESNMNNENNTKLKEIMNKNIILNDVSIDNKKFKIIKSNKKENNIEIVIKESNNETNNETNNVKINIGTDANNENSDEEIIYENDINNVDNSIFKFHPSLRDINFYKKLFSKKEFYDLTFPKETREMDEICGKKNRIFKLGHHQKFLKNYISPNTPYSGVLIYHGTGVGKTCSAISIAEGFKDVLLRNNKKVIIISSTQIKSNFKKELYDFSKEIYKKKKSDVVQCSGLSYELDDTYKYMTLSEKKKKINNLIKEIYQFIPYQKFTNNIMRILNWNGEISTLTDLQRQKIKNIYSNRIIIIDEAQNIRPGSEVLKTKESKKIYNIIKTIVKNANNLKLILMTATPIYDKASEILYIMNLLLLNDGRPELIYEEIFEKNGLITKRGEKILASACKGYISYLRGNDPNTFPVKLFPRITKIPKIKYDLNGDLIEKDKNIKFTKLYDCDLKGKQLKYIEKYINNYITKNDKTNNTNNDKLKKDRNNLIFMSNIMFPVQDNKIEWDGKKIYSTNFGANSTFYKETIETPLGKYFKFKYKECAIINKVPFLDESLITDYSIKFKEILNNLKDSQGLTLIVSKYVSSGALPLSLFLEQNGYMRHVWKGEDQLLENTYKKSYRCYKCQYKNIDKIHNNSKIKGYHKFKIAKYVLLTGSMNDFVKVKIKEAVSKFSSNKNRNGEIIKIIIGTEVIKEGIDFKNIRQLFLLDMWYNRSWYNQIIGRAIRFCSHVRLGKEFRNVTIYNLATSFKNAKNKKIRQMETEDIRRYRIAEIKDYRNKKVEHILKKVAIDCIQNKNKNIINQDRVISQINSLGKKFNFILKDLPYSPECDYTNDCNYKCAWEPKKQITINTNTYDLFFDNFEQTHIIKHINNLFKLNYIYKIDNIIKYIKKNSENIDTISIYKTLNLLINNPKKHLISDKYMRDGYIIHRGDFYIFQPLDIKNEKIPMYYRKTLLTNKTYKMSLNKIDDYINDKEEDLHINKNKIFNSIYKKIVINFKNYEHLRKYDNSKNNDGFIYSVVQNIIIKINKDNVIIFIKEIIKKYINNDKDKIIKDVLLYIDEYLIKYDRELSKSPYKGNNIYGFSIYDKYFYYNMDNKKWGKCDKNIILKIKTIKKYIIKKIKNENKSNIMGSYIKNSRGNIIFQIIDNSTYKDILTQEKKVSKRSIITGRTCTSMNLTIFKDLYLKLGLTPHIKKRTKNFICNEVEIFLYINEYNKIDNKKWFINNI